MSQRYMAATTITSPNPASRAWRGRCGPPLRSIRERLTRCRRRRASSVTEAPSHGTQVSSHSQTSSSSMSVYTVHEPPQRAAGLAADPNRFVFVRDGFSWWAFLLAPLWMLRHRLWLALAIYLLLAVALEILLRAFGASVFANVVVG